MRRFILVLIIMLSSSAVYADNDKAYGINGSLDSLKILKYQEHMARIHEHRPVVALVLSGGGAKGAAHVGTIRRIKELGIPVDMVLGTSMGGLVGGLFCAGYDPDQMEDILKGADWEMLLSDRVPREYISYSGQRYKEKFVLSMPFYYTKEQYSQKMAEDSLAVEHMRGHVDFGADRKGKGKIRSSFLTSLPSGLVSGQHVSNLLSSLLVGYEDEMEFLDLPIPFVTVAADMVSSKPKVFYSGKLQEAMRATMSVPGLFAPVRNHGMVLIDGGTRNNYPVDLARMLGADIVIGSELSDRKKDYSEVNNLGDMFGQAITMLGSESFSKNEDSADVKIKPDLHEFTMMSFDTESVATIIDRGYQAAFDKSQELALVKGRTGRDTLHLKSSPAEELSGNEVSIKSVTLDGVMESDKAILMKKIDVKPGDIVTAGKLDQIVSQIYGTQNFTYVTYEMLGSESPYDLVLHCKQGPVHQVGLGLRFDTQEVVSALVNVGLFAHRLKGHTLDFTARISNNPYLDIHYSYDSPKTPTFNVESMARWTNLNYMNVYSRKVDLAYTNSRNEVYLSNIKWHKMDVRAGLRHNYYNVRNLFFEDDGENENSYSLESLSSNHLALFLNARRYTFDNGYFPTHGFDLGMSYSWVFTSFNKNPDFHIVSLDGKFVIPAGKVLDIIPSFNIRGLLGESVPVAFSNIVGGMIPGRYIDQQIAFPGVNYVSPMDNFLAVGRCDFRFSLAPNHYLTGIFSYARDSAKLPAFFTKNAGNYYATALMYSYNTIFGPISADVHWSTITHKPGFYISIGYDF